MPASVEKGMALLAVGGPLVGLIIGIVLGAHEHYTQRKAVAGLLVGAVGTAIYGLWRLYNVITDALGLDSVANLVLQVIMFAFLGAMLGVAIIKISVLLSGSAAVRRGRAAK